MSICSVYLQISTFLVLSNCIFSNSESVRKILLLNPFGIPSHNVLFETVASTLANAHPDDYELTLVTNSEWKLKEEFPNVKVFQPFKTEHFMAQYLGNICFKLNNHQELRNVMQEKKFDLVIVNGHVHECLYGLLHLMKTPFIVLISTPPPSYVAEPLGNFLPPSIVPLTITDLSDKMTFGQRSKNFLYFVFSKVFVKRNMMPEFESVYRDHLGDNMPSFSDILSNASMIFAINHPRTFFPSQGEILSIQEAVHYSVPILTMQMGAINQDIKTNGSYIGITLWLNQVNEKTLHDAVEKILTNKKFLKRIQAQSDIFKDQEEDQFPGDKLVYWVDNVIQNQGVANLGPKRLNFYNYWGMDIIIFWAFVLANFIFLICNIFYDLYRYNQRRKIDSSCCISLKFKME